MNKAPANRPTTRGPGFREFVALMAALMAANVFAVDTMLPALPAIAGAFGLVEANRVQLVVTTFLIGFGVAQLFYGPLSDHFGRKRVLACSLSSYVALTLVVGFAQSFSVLLVARALQGVAAAGARVLVLSIVRDRFEGSEMARVMSIALIVVMLVPVLAPSIGQGILIWSDWRTIFFLLAAFAFTVLVWTILRLPETLPEDCRRPLSLTQVRQAVAITLSNRVSIGNTLALTVMIGALFAFINSVQQIMFDVFNSPSSLGPALGAIAGCMTLASFLNSRIVLRFGARRIVIAGLCGFVVFALLHLAIVIGRNETLLSFCILQGLCSASLGLVSANLASIAMQPLGHIAGTAASLQGTINTLGGALIGFAVGQLFDGTTLPLVGGFVICGLVSLALALWANRPNPVATMHTA